MPSGIPGSGKTRKRKPAKKRRNKTIGAARRPATKRKTPAKRRRLKR